MYALNQTKTNLSSDCLLRQNLTFEKEIQHIYLESIY